MDDSVLLLNKLFKTSVIYGQGRKSCNLEMYDICPTIFMNDTINASGSGCLKLC